MRETEGSTARVAESAPSLDLVFDLLSNPRRRYALYLLSDRTDGVATVGEITDHIATLECGDDPAADEPPTDLSREIRIELQHVHLPKLEDAGILEIDQRSDTVRYWSQPSLEEWLEHAYHKELS
ncbi:DUF7344 domain-containing protein [Halopiger goleimassiliensis]|uniref:DUF7344 domain-containing protein n=1 Tax=Halopiger goleimassiliensis TaxID=1293048 RepID=UPI0006780B4F|nr:hypothetical protein [Halopiger goleimassiliensis]